MAISDRQAAAIRRRKQDVAAEQKQADERRRLGLVGFQDGAEANPDLVGWSKPSTSTMKGTDHLCIRCHAWQPLGFRPVMRNLLAARMPCTHCGTVLEAIVRASEKK